jgi:hypothetical protein
MYHVAPITSEAVRDGILQNISNVLDKHFHASVSAVYDHRASGDKSLVSVLFEDPMTNPDFDKGEYKNAMNVLYFNNAARAIVEQSGVAIVFTDSVEQLPKNFGVMYNVSHFN